MTSEKVAMGWHLDGRVTAVLGTHTHVPTADCRLLPGGTAHISDVAVVDERLRVHGLQGLRVMDCSVMPTQVSGNTNGPVMAMAWRAADMFIQDAAQ
jgi:calcineurin-like phosphoesterase